MQVSDVMKRDVHLCHAGDSLERAAQIMWEHDCGSVPVADGKGELLGMITDRDITMAAYTSGRDLSSLRIEPIMSTDVVCAKPAERLEDALTSMARGQVHRLPVIDSRKQVVGLLSIADVLHRLEVQDAKERRKLNEPVLHALIDICRPRAEVAPAERTPEPVKTIERPRDKGVTTQRA